MGIGISYLRLTDNCLKFFKRDFPDADCLPYYIPIERKTNTLYALVSKIFSNPILYQNKCIYL